MTEDFTKRCRDDILERGQFDLDESTFRVINPQSAMWIGRVTTTAFAEEGESEASFTILAKGYDWVIVEDDELPALGEWIARAVSKGE
jgi:hypothetical protein